MKKWIVYGVSCFLLAPIFAQENNDSLYMARCQSMIDYYKNLPFHKDAFRALAKLKSNTDLSTAYRIIDSLTVHPQGDMFWLYPMTALYLYAKENLPTEYQDKIKKSFQTYTPLRGDTENHWCMYYVSLFLLSEKEKNLIWFNGKNSLENLQESRAWLYHWMETTVTIGQGEFDSPLYAMFFITPLIMLHDHSQDIQMKNRAKIMLYWLLADFFVDYLDGIYAGANSRIYEYDIFTKRKTLMSSLANFLLGDKPLQNPIPQLLLFAYSNFRLPPILYQIASDRDAPYESIEKKRSRNRIRYVSNRNPSVYRYTYMDKTFSLGSIQEGKTEEILQHTWQLCWKESKPNEITTLFGLHPYFSEYDMASLFPSLRKNVVNEIITSKTSYNKENKWVGASPYEKLFQYKNTLLALYDFSAQDIHFKHYDLFLSKDLIKNQDSSQWIFMQHPSVYIALYPLEKYELSPEKEGERLRSHTLKNGFVLHVENPQNFISFDEFKNKIHTLFKINYNRENHSLTTQTLQGNKLYFSYKGEKRLNKKKFKTRVYPLFKSPFLHSKKGSKKLTIKHKNAVMVLDWEKGQIWQSNHLLY
jgi:hypothetical protein